MLKLPEKNCNHVVMMPSPIPKVKEGAGDTTPRGEIWGCKGEVLAQCFAGDIASRDQIYNSPYQTSRIKLCCGFSFYRDTANPRYMLASQRSLKAMNP
ncbi:hypothetical protein IAQ61_010650 [Plenodomus lingam]|uniref:uncharacterized protein n=1 Tax=Leptosphaeria maculans TaxID=5022 RepID=UPI0033268EAC|nr:hypothetical protein IAQ61_010650 [Plenodomus lingam]